MEEVIDITRKKELLQKQACFSPLTETEFDGLAELLRETHFKAGETIVSEGELVDSVYLIISGTADVRHITMADGTTHIESVATLGPNTSIGLNETGFYSISGRRTATVVALTDMVTLRLSIAEFHGFSLAHFHVHEVMHRNATEVLATKT